MLLREVGFRYRRRGPWVLQSVTVEVPAGQAVVLHGRNGAGKSTLLGVLAGTLTPQRGAVLDRPRRIGWVPERFPAGQPFTVHGYLTAMAAVVGLDRSARAAAVHRWCERLGLGPFTGTRLADLSKGTAQKVGLAQALLVPPELLILDEPWEGLDASTREVVPALVTEVLAAGGAVVVSDHREDAARLPVHRRWQLSGSTVTSTAIPADPPAHQPARHAPPGPPERSRPPGGPAPEVAERWVIEVSVPAGQGPAVLSGLRAAGHQVLRVDRPEPSR